MSIKSLPISETQIQSTFLEWLAWNYAEVRSVTFAIPNGGRRTWTAGKKLKSEGMTAGIPDVLICVARHGYNGFFIEFKSLKGRLSIQQQKLIELLKNQNYKVEVCYSIESATKMVTDYLQEPKE
jgi:hypothetical protein